MRYANKASMPATSAGMTKQTLCNLILESIGARHLPRPYYAGTLRYRTNTTLLIASGARDRNGNEPRRVLRFQPHQDGALAILLGLDHRIAHVARAGDFLAGH